MAETPYSYQVNKNELKDLLENIGILQEVNRTFFNPLGLNLILNKDSNLELHITNRPEGIIIHTIDKFKLEAFKQYRNQKHRDRQTKLGCIIQIESLIRKDKLEENKNLNLSKPENLKLNKLLRCVDDAAYNIKKRFMEKSKDYDSDLNIPFDYIQRGIDFDIKQGKFTDAIAKMILLHYQDDIENELEKIKKIKEEQDKVFKKEKDDDRIF